MAPTGITCTECGANPAEYTVIQHGEPDQHMCDPSLEDWLVDIVTNNDSVSFETTWPEKKGGQIKAVITVGF